MFAQLIDSGRDKKVRGKKQNILEIAQAKFHKFGWGFVVLMEVAY